MQKSTIKKQIILLLAFVGILYACSNAREQAIPITADFNVQVIDEDFSVPVLVQISNTTAGAEQYSWTFKNALKQTNGIDAFNLIDRGIDNSGITRFAYDPKTINKIAEISSETSVFRTALGDGWKNKLDELLDKHSHLRCEYCGPSSTYASAGTMDAFLTDVNHFYGNFQTNGKASKFFNWLNRTTITSGPITKVTNTSLHEMYQTIYFLRKNNFTENTINQMGANLSTLQNSRQSDILDIFNNHIELKNKLYTTISSIDAREIDQVVGVKGAFGNISNLSQYTWVAAKWKGNNTDDLKALWKQVFSNTDASKGVTQTQIFETIWKNTSLRNDLFGDLLQSTSDINVARALSESNFVNMTNDTNSVLYNFIKVE